MKFSDHLTENLFGTVCTYIINYIIITLKKAWLGYSYVV